METSGTRDLNSIAAAPVFERSAELEAEFYSPFIKSFEGFKHREIASMLQIPVAIVKLRIRLARRVLGYHLDNYVAEDSV